MLDVLATAVAFFSKRLKLQMSNGVLMVHDRTSLLSLVSIVVFQEISNPAPGERPQTFLHISLQL